MKALKVQVETRVAIVQQHAVGGGMKLLGGAKFCQWLNNVISCGLPGARVPSYRYDKTDNNKQIYSRSLVEKTSHTICLQKETKLFSMFYPKKFDNLAEGFLV